MKSAGALRITGSVTGRERAPSYSSTTCVSVRCETSNGTMAATCPFMAYTTGAATLSKKTRVAPTGLDGFPSLVRSHAAIRWGPAPAGNSTTTSPGVTPPPR